MLKCEKGAPIAAETLTKRYRFIYESAAIGAPSWCLNRVKYGFVSCLSATGAADKVLAQ